MGSMVRIIRAVLGMIVIRTAAILVVPDRHALCSRHRRHALNREGQGKQRDSEKADDPMQHCRKLYASRLEPNPFGGFRHPAQ